MQAQCRISKRCAPMPECEVQGGRPGVTNDDNDAADERLRLQHDIRAASAKMGFELAYQPQFDLLTNRVTAFEALLRWADPKRGDVPPGEFIPVIEETGLIDDIGQWVLEQACLEASRWPDEVSVAVNLSAVQLHNRDLPAVVTGALRGAGLQPARLELEITETHRLPLDAACLDTLQAIRNIGVRIAMDDFDIGYSCLSYLVRFPFDKIKIDRFFIARMAAADEGHTRARAIVRATIALCKDLKIKVVAEGVETLEQLTLLREAHCTEVQGFLCGRPQPPALIPSVLAATPGLLAGLTRQTASEARAEHALWVENVPFLEIAEGLNDVVIVTTPELTPPGPVIVYVNPAFTRLTGYSASEAIGQSPRMLQGPGTSRAVLDKIARELREGRPVHEKILNFGKSGAPYWLDIKIIGLRDGTGTITHFAAIERDVTLDKRRLDELELLADRDALTGIPNRRALLRAISQEIQAKKQAGNAAANAKGPCLIFMDIDHFKKINDEHGHAIGDAVLCGIAECLVENVRRIDMLGRVGGEEFAVCMPAVDLQEAKALAGRLRSAVARTELSTPTGPMRVTMSVGVSCFVSGDDVSALAARADAAMYAAKRAGRNRVRARAVG
jgi:diguanylate cyclase (GGDEF)-like protein/PAS domain S-box-containing protein